MHTHGFFYRFIELFSFILLAIPIYAGAAPAGPIIKAHLPGSPASLQTQSLSAVTVFFNQAIDFAPGGGGTFTTADVTLTGPNGNILIVAEVTALCSEQLSDVFGAGKLEETLDQRGLLLD